MRSAAAAFAWTFAMRHRVGFLLLGAYFVALTAVRFLALTGLLRLPTEWDVGFAFLVVVPGTLSLYWLIIAFTFGYNGNLAGRQSVYPSRLFTLPMTNTALTAWPMLYGAGCVVLLWIATRIVAPWPVNLPIPVPLVWPGLLGLVLLAWTQAIIWASYPLPMMRVVVTVVGLTSVQVLSVLAIEFEASETVMVALLAPQLPIAFLVARHVVSRARCGGVTDRSAAFERFDAAFARRGIRRTPFANARAAQFWLEWKRFGRSLPMFVAIVLPVELLPLWASRNAPTLVFVILAIVVFTPPFLASFTALAVRKSGAGDEFGVSPFTATRPLSSAALVGARLTMAAWSTAAAWALVIPAVPIALMLSNTWPIVADRAQAFANVVGTPRAVVFGALVLTTLVLTTWRQMVQSLYLGLSGRTGLIKGSGVAMLCGVVAIGPFMEWAWTNGAREWFWVLLCSSLGVIVAVRAVLASWIAMRLQRDRLLSDRSLLLGAALWLAAVIAVYIVLLWLFATPIMPRFLLLLIATVTVPLVRLSAAPLALAWNRHR